MEDWRILLDRPEFPRSSRYDAKWVLDNQMGPSALWLTEWLTHSLALAPEMRVLDLGCGRAISSVFLAAEFGVRVWAVDLWVGPDQNWRRVVEAGVDRLVCPLRAEAHALPFAHGFFDAVVCIDAYAYFGTDDLYLSYLAGFLRPGGIIGVVVPGLTQSIEGQPPAHLTEPQANGKRFWEDECRCFHTTDWWLKHWSSSRYVAQVEADLLPDGWRHWRDFEKAVELAGKGYFPSDEEALDRDRGRYLGFVRLTARRTEEYGEDLYDSSLGIRAGVDG
jgi:cyclopropane fatty-acyl-phospholipid synthase-like methyltransferase